MLGRGSESLQVITLSCLRCICKVKAPLGIGLLLAVLGRASLSWCTLTVPGLVSTGKTGNAARVLGHGSDQEHSLLETFVSKGLKASGRKIIG